MSDAVTVVVPAYNEAGRIASTVRELVESYRVVVVDDGSTDGTASRARAEGATVIEHTENQGYIAAVKRGFRAATSDVVVTFDADGEHRPREIPALVEPILTDEKDLVLGARRTIPRPSERLLNRLARVRVDVSDSGTGLRALRRSLAVTLELDTACTCGTLVLEAAANGARIGEVRTETRSVAKPRGIAWQHGRQLFHVLRYLLRR
jgi:glycosyltransferase involved in cell wall biosynthesis